MPRRRAPRDRRRNAGYPSPVGLGSDYVLRVAKPPIQSSPNYYWVLEDRSVGREIIWSGRVPQAEAERLARAEIEEHEKRSAEGVTDDGEGPSIGFVVALWVTLIVVFQPSRGDNTTKNDRRALRAVKSVPNFAALPAEEAVGMAELELFAATRRSHVARSTVQGELILIRSAYRWVQARQSILWKRRSEWLGHGVRLPRGLDLSEMRIVFPKEYRGQPKAAGIYAKPEITVEQGASIVRNVPTTCKRDAEEWRFAVWLVFTLGLRPSELEALRWDWWSAAEGMFTVPADETKDKQERFLYLPEGAAHFWRPAMSKLSLRRGEIAFRGKEPRPSLVFGCIPSVRLNMRYRISAAAKAAGIAETVNPKALRQMVSNAYLDENPGDWEGEGAALGHSPDTAQTHYRRWKSRRGARRLAAMNHGVAAVAPPEAEATDNVLSLSDRR